MSKKKPKRKNASQLGTGKLKGEISFHDFNSFGMRDLPRSQNARIDFDEEDWRRLQEYANAQCNQREIAAFFGINIDTLAARIKERYNISFSEYLLTNNDGGNAALRRRLFELAFSKNQGNVQAAIWLSKNHLGMKDNVSHDIDVKPLTFAYSLEDNDK